MNTHINVRRIGLSFGLTGVLLYLGCMVAMVTAGRDTTVKFFNSLLHGLDVSSIVRMHVSAPEACLGLAEVFILGWLTGACVAGLYNVLSFDRN